MTYTIHHLFAFCPKKVYLLKNNLTEVQHIYFVSTCQSIHVHLFAVNNKGRGSPFQIYSINYFQIYKGVAGSQKGGAHVVYSLYLFSTASVNM